MANTTFDPNPAGRSKPRFLKLRLAFLLLILALVSLSEPRIFQFVVRQVVVVEAWRHGGSASVRSVEGSLFEPVVLLGTTWSFPSSSGAMTRVGVDRVTAEFDWQTILKGTPARLFERLTLDGVSGKIELARGARHSGRARGWMSSLDLGWLRAKWIPAPAVVEARGVDLLIVSGGEFLRLEQARLRVSKKEPGIIKASRISVQHAWLKRSFPNVRGTTALQDGKLLIARLRLEPGVEISSFSTNLENLTRDELDQIIQVNAFGGEIRAEAELKADTQPRQLAVRGSFQQIDIGRLASFLSLSEAAGGLIKEGKFSFNGSPHDVQHSTTWMHVDAANFQWESRQWDSLVLGMTLIDRRLQVHECALNQGHNELRLDGDLTLPDPDKQWWQGDFNCNVAARIENLTELSALLLPEFTYTAGRGNIDGSVRGHGEKFQGHLVIAGSKLRWRDAPIEELHAALRIAGNELQVAHFSAFNGDDYVRGNGVVNILGPTQYWGTLRASVADLGNYAALLQKPIVPEPLAGGALIDWDGEGSAKGHSGKFVAHLRKLRSPGERAAQLHPINADLEGSYAAGGVVFSKFALSDDESSFTANVAVGNMALALQGIRLMHQQQLWLEGDALLPLDVWRKWPNTSLDSLLTDEVQSKVTLTAYNLELGAASKLAGWKFPIAGVVNGNFTAEGPLSALKTGGKFTIADAKLPLGTGAESLTSVAGEVAFDGATMTIARLVGQHPTGDFRAVGKVDLQNVRDPGVQMLIESDKTDATLFGAGTLSAALKLELNGPLSAGNVTGSAAVLSGSAANETTGHRQTALNITHFWSQDGAELPAVFPALAAPWSAWTFDVAVRGGPLEPPSQLATCDLRLSGTGAAPSLTGWLTFQDVPLVAGDVAMRSSVGSLATRSGTVFIDAHATGELHGFTFAAHLLGPLAKPMRFFEYGAPLTETLLNDALAGRYREAAPLDQATRFGFHAPSAFVGNIEVFPWILRDPAPEVSTVPPPPDGTALQ